MFSGIIEEVGEISEIKFEEGNATYTIKAQIAPEVKIDQSISHEGICLTVIGVENNSYDVSAVKETLELTNLSKKGIGDFLNLERCVRAGDRLDGHIVQGHVDAIGTCLKVSETEGSWRYTFSFPIKDRNLVVSKGSISINGVSLTVIDPTEDQFSVAIIPYTHEHTTFKQLNEGDTVNLEYDIIGKYLDRRLTNRGL